MSYLYNKESVNFKKVFEGQDVRLINITNERAPQKPTGKPETEKTPVTKTEIKNLEKQDER